MQAMSIGMAARHRQGI